MALRAEACSVLCTCESSGDTSGFAIARCRCCNLTVCGLCAAQLQLETHSMVPLHASCAAKAASAVVWRRLSPNKLFLPAPASTAAAVKEAELRAGATSAAKPRFYPSCAVVGNSGALLKMKFGAAIDSHAAVFRLNHAPAGGDLLAPAVGSKTTYRVLNRQWHGGGGAGCDLV